MTTVDWRTRHEGDSTPVDLEAFVTGTLAALLDANGREAGVAAARAGVPPLSVDVGGPGLRLGPDGGGCLTADRATSGPGLRMSLDAAAFSDLVHGVASTFGLHMTGRALVEGAPVDQLIAWEPVLRCLFDGAPAYVPGSITLRDRHGGPLDIGRSFTLADQPADIGHFLAEAGFLHIRAMFTDDEMAAVSSDLDRAHAAARRDDGASWWARTEVGGWYPSRILGFNTVSDTLRDLLHTDRFRSIAGFTDDRFVQRDPDRSDAAEGLHKKVGVVEGISDVSWHKDCSMGNHSRICCQLVVGISVTGAGPDSGELGVVPGSHRANIAPLGIGGLDLPRLPLPTATGDVTVHCSCTLHMSRPPVSAERRVVYTGFDLARRDGDHVEELTAEEIRRRRAELNDHVRGNQRDGRLDRTASFEL